MVISDSASRKSERSVIPQQLGAAGPRVCAERRYGQVQHAQVHGVHHAGKASNGRRSRPRPRLITRHASELHQRAPQASAASGTASDWGSRSGSIGKRSMVRSRTSHRTRTAPAKLSSTARVSTALRPVRNPSPAAFATICRGPGEAFRLVRSRAQVLAPCPGSFCSLHVTSFVRPPMHRGGPGPRHNPAWARPCPAGRRGARGARRAHIRGSR
jgi:hypothetical protein